jgi:hypothetical protein
MRYTAAVVALACGLAAARAGGDATLDAVLKAHREGRAAIRTCTGTVEETRRVLAPDGREGVSRLTGEYVRSGDAYRLRVTAPNGRHDVLVKDGVARRVERPPQSGAYFTRAGDWSGSDCDPWAHGLLAVPVPNSILRAPLETLLETATKIRRVERRADGPREVVAIDLTYDRPYRAKPHDPPPQVWDVTILLDPAANHLVRRVTLTCHHREQKQQIRRENEVTRFAEPVPGVFFPEEDEFRVYQDGRQTYTIVSKVVGLRVNAPVAPDRLRLIYPHGTKVGDAVRGTEYQVDSDGKPITAETPRRLVGAIQQAGGAAQKPVTPRTETKEEPQPATRWVLPASLAALAAAGVLAVARRYREGRR